MRKSNIIENSYIIILELVHLMNRAKQKAVSPLIGGVLLIVITLTAALLVTNWVRDFSREQTETIREKGESRIVCSYAGLALLNATYNCTAAKFSAEAYNSGDQNLESFKFLILLKNGSSYTLAGSPNITLYAGETQTFTNSSLNVTFSQIDRLTFMSATCPLTAKSDLASGKITSYGC